MKMQRIENEDQLRDALKSGDDIEFVDGSHRVVLTGNDARTIVVRGEAMVKVVAYESSQPRVVAWESSQPHVVALESSQPRVEAYGSSQPHVVARGSSQPHVEARGSSQPRVEAWGYVQLSVQGAVTGTAAPTCAVLIAGTGARIRGGKKTHIKITTPREWCDFYGVKVRRGMALLYKALNDDYTSPYGMSYAPGTKPVAPDWDGGTNECGGGLHFSPTPGMARAFHSKAVRYCGCWVKLEDIAIHPNGEYPSKCKARAVARPCFEVDEDGELISGEHA